jgi:hypothetical protein
MAARGEAQADVEVSTLVVPAWRLRWRAPELALVLGERAVALASTRRDEIDRLRAESLVVFASNRMGRGVRIADRALDALRASEKAGEQETSWRLRIELAACATAVGAPLTGFGAVRPVLAAEGVPRALRAAALVQAGDCLVTIGRGPQLGMALSEADQLYVADTTLDADTRLLQRGLLHASAAAQHRRWGDLQAATDAAGKGLELLGKLADPSVDSGQVRAKLTLELVCALMDSNRLGEASEIGSPLLDLPVRAPSAGDVGWLRLALATRVHLPAGRIDLARGMLRDAADSAQRHQLDTLLAESLLALAHVHEVSGDLAEALTDLRSAHAAERRRARAVYAVRARLAAEFSGAHRQPVSPHEQLGSLLRPGDGRTSSAQGAMRGSQPPADAVLAPELKQQLRQWRPVQAPKQEGPRVKRALRAAEDMTVEGISAARAHAADRWRLVQPFGAATPDPTTEAAAPPAGGRRRAEDREPASAELPPTAASSDESAVSATGLIAAAGAMRSGRRRAAREAAEEDTTPVLPSEPSAPTAPWATSSAAPEPEPTPDTSGTTPEVANVLDSLKAAGLLNKPREGGRRRAPDAEADTGHPAADQSAASEPSRTEEPPQPVPETPKWRVEPPQRLRSEEDQPKPPPSDLFDAATTVHPVVGADGLPVERPTSGISAAFPKGPPIPTARTPQSSSTPEPPRSSEPPGSTHQSADPATPPGTHPTGSPHVGPDFRLGADSLGRSGFRPASDRPASNAPQAFTGDPSNPTSGQQAPQSARPPTAAPNQGSATDFHLSADSFGRDGFRTGNRPTPTDPDPTTPQNWPPATAPQDPSGTPDWADGSTSNQGPDTDHQPHPGFGPDSPAVWNEGGAPGPDAGRQSDAGSGWAAGGGQSGLDAGSRPHPDLGSGSPSSGWGEGGVPGLDAGRQSDAGSGGQSGLDAGPRSRPDFGSGSPSSAWNEGGVPGPGAGRQSDAGPGWASGGGSSSVGHQPPPGFGSDTPASDRSAEAASGADPGPAREADRMPPQSPGWAGGSALAGSDSGLPARPAFGTDSPSAGWPAGAASGSDAAGRPDSGLGGSGTSSSDWRSGVPMSPDHGLQQDLGRGPDGGPDAAPGSAGGLPTRPDHGSGARTPDWSTGGGSGAEASYRSDAGLGRRSSGPAGSDTGVQPGHGTGSGPHQGDWATGFESGPVGGRQEHGTGSPQPTGGSPDWAATPDARPEFGGLGDGYGSGSEAHRRSDDPAPRQGDSQGWGAGQDTGPQPGHGRPGSDWPSDPSSSWGSESPTHSSGDGASGFPGAAFGPGLTADLDFPRPPAHDDLTVPQPSPAPVPDPEPDQVPPVPEPDPIPPIPDPDPIPQPAPIPMPPTSSGFDLGRSRFLTSADVEDDLPELPRRVPAEAPPVADEPPDPFVTAVVVGDRTIEVPSAARASRRHKSDLSLAELLTEALVAYETGRRSDPGADQTASEEIADWMSSAETPAAPISPDRLERAGHHVAEPEPEHGTDAEPSPKPKAEPTDSEKTTYLTPVRDLESTRPIWEAGPDGEPGPPYDSWTLPES